MPSQGDPPGIIEPQKLYTLAEFKRQLGIKDATLRAARRAGLRVHECHGRRYVHGQEWIRYVLNSPG